MMPITAALFSTAPAVLAGTEVVLVADAWNSLCTMCISTG
jgi:hypothetical protein